MFLARTIGADKFYNVQGDVLGLFDDALNVVVEYTYDSWGNILSVTGSKAATVGKANPFRYRGYYYDEESGLYYLQSRYYDPATGRFLNADGYVSTGQGILSSNMYAYCENNPVNRVDETGRFWNEIGSFFESLVTGIGNALKGLTPAYAACGGVAVADGPLPFLDAFAAAGAVALTLGAVGYGVYQATQAASNTASKAEEKPKAKFTINPLNFNPKGLARKVYVEPGSGSNGGIIKWEDPKTNVAIFEWNEDYKHGAHYHAMLVEWDSVHDGTHYLPGTTVPEPWQSMYFGG